MRGIKLLLVASASVSLACAGSGAAVGSNNSSGTKVVAIDQDFGLSQGETAAIDGGALTVNFVKVAEDSRCPTGVQCVWAGNGAASLTIAPSGASKFSVTLNTMLTPRTATASSYSVSLVGLEPYPKQGSTIPAASYIATLRITRQ